MSDFNHSGSWSNGLLVLVKLYAKVRSESFFVRLKANSSDSDRISIPRTSFKSVMWIEESRS